MGKLFNRVRQATATTGAGTVTLGAASSGYQTLASAGAVTGDIVSYFIEDGTAWEVGTGTYTSAGTTLSRTVIQSSLGGTTPLTLSGSAVVTVAPNAGDLPASPTVIDAFTASGTWTKRPGLVAVFALVIAGGGGGGSGRKGAAASDRSGGGGGGGGHVSFTWLPASALGATETVTVGAGGTGGAAVTANSTNGNNGGIGGASFFGTWVGTWQINSGSGGGTTSGAGATPGTNGATFQGSGGGNGSNGAGSNGSFASQAATGGGGGGGINSANTASAGGSGGGIGAIDANITLAGGAVNNPGSTATARATGDTRAGLGGGGGGASLTGNGGNGGAGQEPGGGGGGGGAAVDSVGNSGAGGSGGNGRVVVINYF